MAEMVASTAHSSSSISNSKLLSGECYNSALLSWRLNLCVQTTNGLCCLCIASPNVYSFRAVGSIASSSSSSPPLRDLKMCVWPNDQTTTPSKNNASSSTNCIFFHRITWNSHQWHFITVYPARLFFCILINLQLIDGTFHDAILQGKTFEP